ncbi:MAG: ABC transporter permease [Bacteroidota bacterium]
MLKNHLLLILRNAWRYRGYTLINTVGLAVGVACCLVIALFVHDEWTTDQFHPGADRIYWVNGFMEQQGYYIGAPSALPNALLNETTHTEQVIRLSMGGRVIVQHDGQVLEENNAYETTSEFFSMFGFSLAEGDTQTALSEPGTVVLANRTAAKYFPEQSALGQTLTVDGEILRVTGVAAPPLGNSFLDFTMLRAIPPADLSEETTWGYGRSSLFVRLTPSSTEADLNADLALLQEQHMSAETGVMLKAEPLRSLYFDLRAPGTLKGNLQYLGIFATIAVLVLLLACVNYMNLATAQASRYAREVGVRKAVGAQRGQIVARFLGESVVIAVVALLLSLGLAELALPTFNQIVEKTLAVPYTTEVLFWAATLALALGTGIAAGSYPALYLSKLDPVRVLKGHVRETGGQAWLRKSLVVFQFAVTVVFLVGTFVVRQQLDFLQTRNLGLNPDQVVSVSLTDSTRSDLDAFRQEVGRLPGVMDMAIGDPLRTGRMPVTPEGMTGDDVPYLAVLYADASFIPMMEVEVLEGRAFNPDLETDLDDSVLLNEAAAQLFGWHDDAVGRTVERYSDDFQLITSTVVGVVKDFNFKSLRQEVEPVMIQLQASRQSTLLIKVDAERTADVVAGVEALHYQFAPEKPFKYSFLDERFDAFYRSEERLGQIFGFFAGLAVFVACLGLFGLAAFLAEQRTKEIGIRKVLGASASGLLALLTRDFIKLVAVAVVVATPLAYIVMTRWLSDFAFRIDLGPTVFLIAGALALGIAVATVSYQALKVARANPIEALRYE